MDRKKIAGLLDHLSFSAALPEKLRQELASKGTLRRVSAGALIFREGTENHEFFVLSQGHVALEMDVPGRGKNRLLTLGPGDLVAWSALLGDGRMTATAIALENSELIAFSGPVLIEVCQQNYELGYHLMRRLAEALSTRLVATRLQLLDLFSTTEPTTFR